MFVAVYEFDAKPGQGDEFRAAWLEVTKLIYQHCGSYGSRLHSTDDPDFFVAYAQWPDRETWESSGEVDDPEFLAARQRMRDTMLEIRTIHELTVSDDFLQAQKSGE